ncbi:PRKR-interacting protein 1 [Bienertia sinuspersici]
MSTGQSRAALEGDLQIVSVNDKPPSSAMVALPPKSDGSSSNNALVAYSRPLIEEEQEDLEIKLRRIIDNVPVRVSNTSGSSAGSGSGDFHQYRQMRRREQDRLARIEVDYQRRKEVAEFEMRREQRLKATEERTSKKRAKRQKKKQKKKEKKCKLNAAGEEHPKEDSSDDSGDNTDNGEQPGAD